VIELPRDRYGNPLITLPDGTTETYVRASNVGDALDDKSAIQVWGERMVVKGIASSDHVRTLVSLADVTDDKALGAIARKAKDAAGAWTASDLGTAIHRLTERLDLGEITMDDVDDRFRPSLTAYRRALDEHGLTPIEVERIVVADEIKVAGTLDRLLRTRHGDVVVADIKTGKAVYPPSKGIACQLAAYAHSVFYDPATATRTPIDGLRTDAAIVIHLPASGDSCTLWRVDTERGYELCRLAIQVRDARKEKLLKPLVV
jgi:hypothetical protein